MICDTCNGKCCTKFVIFVTARDAARIVNALHLEPTYFLNYYPAEIDSKFPVFKIKGKKYILGLDSKNGSIKDCRFLIDIGGYRRCGIYKYRPLNCRTYPFTFKDRKLDFVEEFVCPKQWWPEGKEREEYVDNINKFNKELKEYEKVVGVWNRNFGEKGSFTEFLNFILKR